MKLYNLKTLAAVVSAGFLSFVNYQSVFAQKKDYLVIGYVGAFGRPINVNAIEAKKLTHINYSFVDCKDSIAIFDNPHNDSTNLRLLGGLKKINPNLKILISIGGGTRSRFISNAVLTPTSRYKFVRSAMDMVEYFKLDGVDMDWEYPGQISNNNNVFREVDDKTNFTLMFKEFRRQMDEMGKRTGKKYLLTGAFNVSKVYTDHVELSEVAKYMDFINLMTYDFTGAKNTVGHHTNLYNYGTLGPRSADKGIIDYIRLGVPPEKLTLGVAFYSHTVKATTTYNHGLGQPAEKAAAEDKIPSGGYTYLKDSLVNKKGFKRYWDDNAKAPYLFNDSTRYFISYDDEKSTKEKAAYVKRYHLAGAFFWEYYNDPKNYLLNVLDKELRK